LQTDPITDVRRPHGTDQRLPRFFLEFFSASGGNGKSQDIVFGAKSAVSSPAHGEQGFSHSSAGDGVGSVEARIRL